MTSQEKIGIKNTGMGKGMHDEAEKRPPPPSDFKPADVPIQKQALPTTEEVEEMFSGATDAIAAAVKDTAISQPYNTQSTALVQTLRDERVLITRSIEQIRIDLARLKDRNNDYQKTLTAIDRALGVLLN